MDKMGLMATFALVFKTQSLAAAARKLDVTPAVITRRLSALEDELGVRLFHRTTRSVKPTHAAEEYNAFVARLFGEIEAIEASLLIQQKEPRGDLRVCGPKAFNSLHMGEAIGDFITLYPRINVSVLNETPLEATRMLENRIDLAFRMTRPQDSSLMTRRICKVAWIPCASPQYLASAAPIKAPADLTKCNCLCHVGPFGDRYWTFSNRRGETRIRVRGNIESDNVLVLRGAALSGRGIALLPHYTVADDLHQGRLVHVLPHHHAIEHELFVVFPYRSYVPNRVRVFIDFMVDRFRRHAWK